MPRSRSRSCPATGSAASSTRSAPTSTRRGSGRASSPRPAAPAATRVRRSHASMTSTVCPHVSACARRRRCSPTAARRWGLWMPRAYDPANGSACRRPPVAWAVCSCSSAPAARHPSSHSRVADPSSASPANSVPRDAVDYREPDWLEQFDAVAPDGVDVVFDGVGGDFTAALAGAHPWTRSVPAAWRDRRAVGRARRGRARRAWCHSDPIERHRPQLSGALRARGACARARGARRHPPDRRPDASARARCSRARRDRGASDDRKNAPHPVNNTSLRAARRSGIRRPRT